jgi:hypothetical protein
MFLPVLLATLAINQVEEPSRFQVMLGATAAKSSWPSDAAANGSLKLAYAPYSFVSFYALLRLGYANTNERMLTFISGGAQFTLDLESWRPYARIAFAHQHEEPVHLVKHNPAHALLGIAHGIHHRGGGEAGLGVELPIFKQNDLEAFAAFETSFTLFVGDGPSVYAGGTAGIGINYSL